MFCFVVDDSGEALEDVLDSGDEGSDAVLVNNFASEWSGDSYVWLYDHYIAIRKTTILGVAVHIDTESQYDVTFGRDYWTFNKSISA